MAERARSFGGPPTVLFLPGASLLDILPLTDGMALVRCPGCGATKVFTARPAAGHEVFVHELHDCPVLARIEAGLARLSAGWTAEGN
jgi:hypothetical protein